MADTHHKPEMRTPTTSRSYTVGYVRDQRKFQPSPSITQMGHWLAEAGFATGTPVDVRVMPDCLILTAREPASQPEPEIMQALKRVCKLSARKQRQVTELIEVISRPQTRNGN